MREHLKNYIEWGTTSSVRGLRILLEYFYATESFEPHIRDGIRVVSVFGSARARPHAPEYRIARDIGRRLYQAGFAVVTGASRGVMQAANQGVAEGIALELVRERLARNPKLATQTRLFKQRLKQYSIGLGITLPFEPDNNPYVGANATFHYFMMRKFFFASLSQGFIACEGGWGTRDEFYEMLTLVQTGKAPLMPIVYVSSDARHFLQDFNHTLRRKYIDPADASLVTVARSAAQAVAHIARFYRRVDRIEYPDKGVVRIYLKSALPRAIQTGLARLGKGLKAIRSLEISPRAVTLAGFDYSSFGHVMRLVDWINK